MISTPLLYRDCDIRPRIAKGIILEYYSQIIVRVNSVELMKSELTDIIPWTNVSISRILWN